MHQLYQDAMTIVRSAGKPDLFITFTCNPSWPEITAELLPGQSPPDRPDLITRVFNIKLKELLHDLLKRQIFGKTVAHIYVIEFQKRGFPHVHMLLILTPEYKPRTAEDFDRIISAELPDPTLYPLAHDTVRMMMMYRPCSVAAPNAPCMKNSNCTKHYSHRFNSTTVENLNRYPVYCQHDNEQAVEVKGTLLNNR